jgi:hypothetical protein
MSTDSYDFQSPKRKRKGPPRTAAKKMNKQVDSTFDHHLLGDISSGAATVFASRAVLSEKLGNTSGNTANDSSDNQTTASKYGSQLSSVNTTQIRDQPANHLVAAFPDYVQSSPVVPSRLIKQTPSLRESMLAPGDSDTSLSFVSTSGLHSPPSYGLDRNDLSHRGPDFLPGRRNVGSPLFSSKMRSTETFDEVESPEVGAISMVESPLHDVKPSHASDSPTMLMSFSPRVLGGGSNSPKRAMVQPCVRHMHLRSHAGGREGSPELSSFPRGALFCTSESDRWAGDSTGVASRMSTLNVNKHHRDDEDDMDGSRESANPRYRKHRHRGDGDVSSSRNQTSPIMSEYHSSFMDLLDAAADGDESTPCRRPLEGGGDMFLGAPVKQIPKWDGNDYSLQRAVGVDASTAPRGFRFDAVMEPDEPVFSLFGEQNAEGSSKKLFCSPTRAHSIPNGAPPTPGLAAGSGAATVLFKSPARAAVRGDSPSSHPPLHPHQRSPAVDCSMHRNRLSFTPDEAKLLDDGDSDTVSTINSSPLPPASAHAKWGSDRSLLSTESLSRGRHAENSVSLSNSAAGSLSQLPLPDQSAFDNSMTKQRRSTGHQSPVCPPTPDRSTIHWAGAAPASNNSSFLSTSLDDSSDVNIYREEEEFGIPSSGYPLMRHNSLDDTKILIQGQVQLDPTDKLDVSFSRDFDNLGLLGSGSFADVYQVSRKEVKLPGEATTSLEQRRKFAVKKNRKKFRGRGDRESLLNEVRMMNLAGTSYCPYIVHLVRAWQEDSFFFVQMDIAERGSLLDLLVLLQESELVVPDAAVWQIAHDTLHGLKHLHAHGVIHLDIKPANLLISRSGKIMIGDFGLAAPVGERCDENGDTRYMAPELLNFDERQTPCDIFSFGLSLFEVCVSGSVRAVLPVSGTFWSDLREGRIPSMDTATCTRPTRLGQLVLACLVPDPRRRATASELVEMEEIIRIGLETKDSGHPVLLSAPLRAPIATRMRRSVSYQDSRMRGANEEASLAIDVDVLGPPLRYEDSMRTPTAGPQGVAPFGFIARG